MIQIAAGILAFAYRAHVIDLKKETNVDADRIIREAITSLKPIIKFGTD